jgi:hypothetical protein
MPAVSIHFSHILHPVFFTLERVNVSSALAIIYAKESQVY